MPDRVEIQDVTCAAGVTSAAPTEVALANVVGCSVVRVTIRIPPGHAGKTGISLGYGHNPVLPRTAGAFISGDDEVAIYDMSNYIDGPQWQAFLVNADTISHAWEIRFEVDEIDAGSLTVQPAPIDLADLNALGSAQVGAG